MKKGKSALCLGGNGFICHHLARRLKSEGYFVRVVDIKRYEYGTVDFADEVVIGDLRNNHVVKSSFVDKYNEPFHEPQHFDEIYVLACQMGGANYVFTGENDSVIMHDSALINLNVLNWCRENNYKGKIFYSSSACIYPQGIQETPNNPGLKETDAWPAHPDSVYGLEKLFSEKLYDAFHRNHGIDIRVARFHNIYGPEGTYTEPRAKAPAAMCRKAIELVRAQRICEEGRGFTFPKDKPLPNALEVWGTGNQTRSFLYIDDCIDAVRLLMESDFKEPINIGSEEMVTINQLAEMAIELSGKRLVINNIKGPVGVMGRNSNNDLIRSVLGWTPTYTLKEGMSRTFEWIKSQYDEKIHS